MLDTPEGTRLARLYESMRLRLLDLSRRNQLLNYKLGSRSKRQLRIVNASLEDAHRRLASNEATLRVAPLPEPDDVPLEERTAEFRALLDRARMTDADYLAGVEAIEISGQDDAATFERLERKLRDSVRGELGLAPRTSRKELDRIEHARRLGIEPSFDLAKADVVGDARVLQTLLFPDELESVMEKVAGEANLAEQEMGVSTLFVALGFLEWYESEASDKKNFAPLLLLPVRVEKQKLKGKAAYFLSVREGGAEPNLSLQKYVEQNFGRQIPDFEAGDEDAQASIEGYLDAVSAAVDGLKQWRVHRWMVLGHFAFGRFAMFADLEPTRWGDPIANPLLRSIVSGSEAGRNPDVLPGVPDDYAIDDPEVEAAAPFLIQDADASQHSVLVDVMKGKNLVVQGPPGTGKSQTITNVIANALAAGKRVLFLAEKQAALQVVKRRLNQAGLGDFCLELHSDKASPKNVIASVRARHELGLGRRFPPPAQFADATWAQSRKEVTDYAQALHETNPDGATTFSLIWRALRGRSVHAGDIEAFASIDMPMDLLHDPVRRDYIRGDLGLLAEMSAAFAANFGDPRHSPWAAVAFDEVQTYDARRFAAAVLALGPVAEAALAAVVRHTCLGIRDEADLRVAAALNTELGPAPPPSILAEIAELNLSDLEAALAARSDLLAAQADVAAMADLRNEDPDRLKSAVAHLGNAKSAAFLDQVPAEAYAAATAKIAQLTELAQALEDVSSVLDFTGDTPALHFLAVASGAVIAGMIPEDHRGWVGALPRTEVAAMVAVEERWHLLLDAETAWTSRLSGYSVKCRPNAAELEAAAATLRKAGVGRAFAALTGSVRAARELTVRLGFHGEPTPADLDALAAHTRAVAEFEADPVLRLLFRKAWAGLDTPIADVLGGLRVRDLARERLLQMAGGGAVLERLLAMTDAGFASAAARLRECKRVLALAAETKAEISNEPATEVIAWARQRAGALAEFLAVDPGRILEGVNATFRRAAEAHALMATVSRLKAALDRHAAAKTASLLGADTSGLAAAVSTIVWLRAVTASQAQDEAKRLLKSVRAMEGRAALRDAARDCADLEASRRDAATVLAEFGAARLAAMPAASLAALVGRLVARRDEVADFASLRRLRERLAVAGVAPFLACVDDQELGPTCWLSLLDAVIAERRAAAARCVKMLALSNGSMLDARRRAFAERDLAKIQADRVTVRAKLMMASPPVGSNHGPRKTWTGMQMLTNEFPKIKRFAPVRQVLARAGKAVQALQPCFMMSPLSLAKFVQPGTLSFDLLVIDEASQMRPEDALGGMLRANQIIVVGDAKQLPPTDFFSRGTAATGEGDDEQDELDAESILEACEATFGERRRLKWHYRSRCESLIAFSNENFYDGGLITFPMAKPDSFSVDLVRVDGIYRASRNPAEATHVAEEAIAFMRHHAGMPDKDIPSLGIVAVNVEQRELVMEELRQLWAGDDLVERYQAKVEAKGEPFFVKNLETVQGDERDYIFISMTYGRKQGAPGLAQNFGPIARKQGHRRLNVLFTRARVRIGLFTSFGSADVRPTEASSEGVHALKRYLAYAETRGRAAVRSIGGEPDSDFEVEVATRLRARGYDVEMQVGVSSFRIDLGVRHPDHPERFLAGVECDGAAFHSSKSARDRDRLREAMLNSLGWDLVRIWSTDWYDDPDLETSKVIKRLEELRRRPPPPDTGYRALHGVTPEAMTATVESIDAAPKSSLEARTEDDTEAASDVDLTNATPDLTDGDSPSGYTSSPEAIEHGLAARDPLSGAGPLTPAEATAVLEAFRERVVRPATNEWEPHRSILRPAMIETFVQQHVSDPADWYARVPQYLRSGTAAAEKVRFLDQICDIVARIGG